MSLSSLLAEAIGTDSTPLQMAEAIKAGVEAKIKAPYVSARVSTLGGADRPSIGVTIGFEPRESWTNGILENSRYAKLMVHVDDKSIVMLSAGTGVTKFRKTRFKTADEAVAKLVKFASTGGKAESLDDDEDDELIERQETDPAMAIAGVDGPTKPGAFKVSSKALAMLKDVPGFQSPDSALFTNLKKLVFDLSLSEVAKAFGEEDISDAQDYVAKAPRQAFNKWLTHVGKVSPKIGKRIRSAPDNAALLFYTFVSRLSGRDMADIILKRYFETESDHIGAVKARMKVEELEEAIAAAKADG